MGVIYKLTSPSGKTYIGQTKQTFQKRWNSHKSSARINSGHCVALERAINKYTAEAFKKEILLECEDDSMNMYETIFISLYDSIINGYNLTSGGDSQHNFSEETKSKMSKSHRDKHGNNLPEYLIKTGCLSAGKTGYQITNHPKCKRKRFTGNSADDYKSLQRAINYLALIDLVEEKEKLPQYISYMKSRNGYSVQIPRSEGNLRKQFASKKNTREQNKLKAVQQLEMWKTMYNFP